MLQTKLISNKKRFAVRTNFIPTIETTFLQQCLYIPQNRLSNQKHLGVHLYKEYTTKVQLLDPEEHPQKFDFFFDLII